MGNATGRATIIHLPDECDAAEVLLKVQARMQLDKRMLYAAELFLPNGDRVRTYETLTDAAAKETAIIVGCGEPFDPTTVPFDILEFHLHGGGRQAARTVKKELQDKKKLEAHEKADSVRASGHGVYPNSVASVTARSQSIESNRGNAAQMRHEYMEQLMFRASQQKELVERVQENNAMQRMEMRRQSCGGRRRSANGSNFWQRSGASSSAGRRRSERRPRRASSSCMTRCAATGRTLRLCSATRSSQPSAARVAALRFAFDHQAPSRGNERVL